MYARSQGIILNEPTVIALNSRTQDVLAMGQEAWQMIGRTPGYIVAVRPLRGGAITDFEITQRMIRLLFQRAGINRLYRARVLICVPSAITHVEQRAVLEAARRAGLEHTILGLGRHFWSFRGRRVLAVDRWNQSVARSIEQCRLRRNGPDERDSVQRGILGRMG